MISDNFGIVFFLFIILFLGDGHDAKRPKL